MVFDRLTMFEYKAGDLIWAKMRGFCPWPARIMAPEEYKKLKRPSVKKPMQPVFFFGYENHAWIEETFIKPFFKFKNDLSTNKTSKFQEAVKATEDYISEHADAAKQQKRREESLDENKATPKVEKKETPSAKQPSEPKSDKGNKRKKSVNSVTPSESKKAKLSLTNHNSVSTPKSAATTKSSPTTTPKEAKSQKASGTPKSMGTPKIKIKNPECFFNLDFKSSVPRKSSGAANFLARPVAPPRPDVVPFDVKDVSKTLAAKKIVATSKTIGFIGLGTMGSGIVKNLLHSGHKVNIWNRTSEKCDDFVEINASKLMTPQDVVSCSDIVFCCVSDPKASQEMVFGNCGVLTAMEEGKSYIELTTIDETTSKANAEAIVHRGGQYLEAQMQGNRRLAGEGNLVILAAGSRSVFEEAQSCLMAMSRKTFFVGEDVGSATKMNLIIQTVCGINVTALAEGMALASRSGLRQQQVMEIFGKTLNASQLLMEKLFGMVEGDHDTGMAISLMQKDLTLALKMGEQYSQQLPMAAAANEIYKHTKYLGYSDFDVSSVYLRYRC